MITIGYSTRKPNPEFSDYIKKSSKYKNLKVIEKVNDGIKSLSQVYNEIINESDTDIVLLCHDDILFDSDGWCSKLIKHFERSDYGILGVAGTTSIPKSGMWWEDRKKMIGIVNHEHGGKKWESKYSESVGNDIDPSIIVDGLFIALHKKRIKKHFVEDFDGFHFYDISFCFENFLSGVKVGVVTNIRITHKSIGITNEKWEINRKKFESKYENSLPVKIPRNPKKRLKVLLSCLWFKNLTGSELYVYELAKNLIKLNCSVTVLSDIGGPLTEMAKKEGVKVLSFNEAPGYKIGDGKWGFNTENGFVPSQVNNLYRVSEVDFDIIHTQHKPITEKLVQMYPEIPKICTIHSEIINLEEPYFDKSIKKYIAIRPEIKTYLQDKFEINPEIIETIYNPVDNEKFKKAQNVDGNYVLFVGTIDYLRRNTIFDLCEYTKENQLELWLVGEIHSDFLPTLLENKHVKHFYSTWNLEKFLKNCKEVAGIQLGRTTIEGWMCGKNAWIYKVDSNGEIISKENHAPPEDIEKFYSKNVAKNVKANYLKILS